MHYALRSDLVDDRVEAMKRVLSFLVLQGVLHAFASAQVQPPTEQRRFIEIVQQAQLEYKRADNAMQKGGA